MSKIYFNQPKIDFEFGLKKYPIIKKKPVDIARVTVNPKTFPCITNLSNGMFDKLHEYYLNNKKELSIEELLAKYYKIFFELTESVESTYRVCDRSFSGDIAEGLFLKGHLKSLKKEVEEVNTIYSKFLKAERIGAFHRIGMSESRLDMYMRDISECNVDVESTIDDGCSEASDYDIVRYRSAHFYSMPEGEDLFESRKLDRVANYKSMFGTQKPTSGVAGSVEITNTQMYVEPKEYNFYKRPTEKIKPKSEIADKDDDYVSMEGSSSNEAEDVDMKCDDFEIEDLPVASFDFRKGKFGQIKLLYETQEENVKELLNETTEMEQDNADLAIVNDNETPALAENAADETPKLIRLSSSDLDEFLPETCNNPEENSNEPTEVFKENNFMFFDDIFDSFEVETKANEKVVEEKNNDVGLLVQIDSTITSEGSETMNTKRSKTLKYKMATTLLKIGHQHKKATEEITKIANKFVDQVQECKDTVENFDISDQEYGLINLRNDVLYSCNLMLDSFTAKYKNCLEKTTD